MRKFFGPGKKNFMMKFPPVNYELNLISKALNSPNAGERVWHESGEMPSFWIEFQQAVNSINETMQTNSGIEFHVLN